MKLTQKKSPRTVQKGKRPSFRKKATVSAARKLANTKLTKAEIAANNAQSKIFNLSRSAVNISELEKKKTTRIFKEHSPGHSKPFIIAASSSTADFMISTPSRSTVSTIAKSPPLRNTHKTHAEATVKKLIIEKTVAKITLLPATQDTTIVDLVDTSDEPQPSPTLTVNPSCSSFGQDIIILSSDLQDSCSSFYTASVNSVPTRTLDHPNQTPMDFSPPPLDPERDPPEHDKGETASTEEA